MKTALVKLKTIPQGGMFRFNEGVTIWKVMYMQDNQYVYCESLDEKKTRRLTGGSTKHHKSLYDQIFVVPYEARTV